MSIAKYLVLALSVVASVDGLITTHAARGHRALAARALEPRSLNVLPGIAPRASSTRKRCRPRPASSSSSVAAKPTPDTPINAAPIPTPDEPVPTTTKTTPRPTATQAPPAPPQPITTKAAPPAPSPSPGGGGGPPPGFLSGVQQGQGTYYATGLGACGVTNKDTDFIVAVSYRLFDNFPGYNGVNPNTNPVCGLQISASFEGVTVTVRDGRRPMHRLPRDRPRLFPSRL